MFHKLITDHNSMIADVKIEDFRRFESAYSLVAVITFIDESVLHIKDYLFVDGRRKYSYHWQDNSGKLITRWDNSPHHPQVHTFPHHKHLPESVEPSHERQLIDIFQVISRKINQTK